MLRKGIAIILACAVWLTGCGGGEAPASQEADSLSSSQVQEAPSSASEEEAPSSQTAGEEVPSVPPVPVEIPEYSDDPEAPLHPYLEELVQGIAAEISQPGMSEYQRAKAAFDYMIRSTYLDEPIGLSLWRVHGGGEEPIPYLEQRALSPLRFGVGMCEDYAAALTLLLRGLGLEAEYVPGLTYSVEGHLVDHAWTAVRIDGVWYHLDSQLEDNISRRGTVRYRYFLKGDATMAGSHLWGQRLIDAGLLTPEQNAEIAAHFLLPDCPEDYPAPERYTFEEPPAPDLGALEAEAAGEIAAWEAENGPLPEMELNTTPPVFGLGGYGPADEG